MKFWGIAESSSAGRTERGLCDSLDDKRAQRRRSARYRICLRLSGKDSAV
jgi:hypothetical protein